MEVDTLVTQCSVCGNGGGETVASVMDVSRFALLLETRYCPTCGSTWRSRRAQDDDIDATPQSLSSLYDPDWEAMRVHRYASFLKAIRKRTPQVGRNLRILDIGSNTGVGTKLLEQSGVDAFGVELDADRVYLSRQIMSHPERIFDGAFEDYEPPAPFDAIMLAHVLEHLHEPRLMLAKIHSMLAEGGLFYVEVPDLSCAVDYRDAFYYAHQVNFCRASLTTLLEEMGFDVVDNLASVWNTGDGYSLAFLCRKTAPKAAAPVWKADLGLAEVMGKYRHRTAIAGQGNTFLVGATDRVSDLQRSKLAYNTALKGFENTGAVARVWELRSPARLVSHALTIAQRKLVIRLSKTRHRAYLAAVDAKFKAVFSAT